MFDIMETIKLTDFFKQADSDKAISLVFEKKNITAAELNALVIKDEASQKILDDIKSFTPKLDEELIRELDNLAKESNCSLTSLTGPKINPSAFCASSDSALLMKGEQVIKARSELLIGLIKAWLAVAKIFPINNMSGSIGNKLRQLKFMLPSSVAGKMVDEAIAKLSSGYGANVEVSRRKAMLFIDKGLIDHEGKYTIYGQIINQMHTQ